MSYPSGIMGRSTVTLMACVKHGLYTGAVCPSCDTDKHLELVAKLDVCRAKIEELTEQVVKLTIWMEKE